MEMKNLIPPNQLSYDLRRAGQEMADEMARLLSTSHPNIEHLALMCLGCAFRRGTEANLYPGTLLSALMCMVDGESFECHDRDNDGHPIPNGKPCHGFLAYCEQSRLVSEPADVDINP